MTTVRAERPRPGATKTLALLAFALGAVWVALSAPASARAPGEVPQDAGAPAAVARQPADDASARMFVRKCAGCHTVGRGKLTGPDLNEASAWPVPDLTRTIKTMERRVGPMSDDDVAALADLLKDPKVKERIKAEEDRAAQAVAASFDPPSAEIGAALFSGRAPFANGGAACAACHVVNGSGGTLGPDLSAVYTKLGEAPLVSACEKTSFKIMSAAYRDHPVTRQEALHLTRFLATAAEPRAPQADPPVAAYGAAAAFACLGALAFAYRKRAPGVRGSLLRRRHDVVD